MRYALLTAMVAFLCIAAAPLSRTPEAADVVALQGTWVLKTTEYLGEKANQDLTEDPIEQKLKLNQRLPEERELPEDFKKYRTTLRFKGRTFVFRQWQSRFCGGEYEHVIEGTYTLDVKRKPKIMGRLPQNEIANGTPLYWTYQVNGNTLQIGIHFDNDPTKLPKTFATDKDPDVAIFTFRKETK